jgi:hypothetical protein
MIVYVAALPMNLRESGVNTTGSNLRQRCKPQVFWHLLEKKLRGFSEKLQ